jgi:hypothetical protein
MQFPTGTERASVASAWRVSPRRAANLEENARAELALAAKQIGAIHQTNVKLPQDCNEALKSVVSDDKDLQTRVVGRFAAIIEVLKNTVTVLTTYYQAKRFKGDSSSRAARGPSRSTVLSAATPPNTLVARCGQCVLPAGDLGGMCLTGRQARRSSSHLLQFESQYEITWRVLSPKRSGTTNGRMRTEEHIRAAIDHLP